MLVLKLDDGARSNQLRVAKCETMSDELCKEDRGGCVSSCHVASGAAEVEGVQWRRSAPERQHCAGIYNAALLPLYSLVS